MAHDHELSGHVGVRKTYDNLLTNISFGLRRNLTFLNSVNLVMHVSYTANPIKLFPQPQLKLIPVLGDPFERILIDCVG